MPHQVDLVLRGGTVHLPGGASEALDVLIDDGQIVALVEPGTIAVTPRTVLEVSGRHVLPGVIDPHFQSGNLSGVDDFGSESRFAAVGGVTTILRMHRSLDAYSAGLEETISAYEAQAWVDFAFHLAVMTEAHLEELPRYIAEFGVTSFKMFTAYKNDMPRSANLQGVDDGMLFACLERIGELGGRALIHCENQEINDRRLAARAPDADGLVAWAATRPVEGEAEAMLRVGYLATLARCPAYLVHCSSALAFEAASGLRRQHPDLAIETIIHYLTHTMESGVGLLGKVAPPLRSAADIEALWAGIREGSIDAVGSDHVPYTRAAKLGASVWETRLGLPGTGLILPVLLSAGVAEGQITLARLVQLTAENPARLFGLSRKGRISPGMDADLVIVDLGLERTVDTASLHGASDWSLYDGSTLKGWPVATISRGQVVVRDGRPVGEAGRGRFIRRQPKVPAAAPA